MGGIGEIHDVNAAVRVARKIPYSIENLDIFHVLRIRRSVIRNLNRTGGIADIEYQDSAGNIGTKVGVIAVSPHVCIPSRRGKRVSSPDQGGMNLLGKCGHNERQCE